MTSHGRKSIRAVCVIVCALTDRLKVDEILYCWPNNEKNNEINSRRVVLVSG